MRGWCDGGIRSFSHWLTITAGFGTHVAGELLRVGHALKTLPKIAEAFAAGQLSFDKVRYITQVATPATDQIMLEIGRGASGAQLERICCAMRRMADINAPKRADEHLRLRGLWTRWDDDGMLELKAKLTPEDAAVVQAALESITRSRSCRSQPTTESRIPRRPLGRTSIGCPGADVRPRPGRRR